jgi:hypothetical protein
VFFTFSGRAARARSEEVPWIEWDTRDVAELKQRKNDANFAMLKQKTTDKTLILKAIFAIVNRWR